VVAAHITTILYYTILYYAILYCTVLYCTVLYCTAVNAAHTTMNVCMSGLQNATCGRRAGCYTVCTCFILSSGMLHCIAECIVVKADACLGLFQQHHALPTVFVQTDTN
jgi:hypothetical protein